MNFGLYDQLRRAAGLQLLAAVREVLPAIAADLAHEAAGATDLAKERRLAAAGALLAHEAESRTERAAAVFDELHFKTLQTGRLVATGDAAKRLPAFELLSEEQLNEQLLAQDLAAKAREALEEAYPSYLSRLGSLVGSPADDDTCALSAKGVAMAFASSLRPFAADPLLYGSLTQALTRRATRAVRQIVADIDARMVAAGVLAQAPRIVLQPDARPRSARDPSRTASDRRTAGPATLTDGPATAAADGSPLDRQEADGIEVIELGGPAGLPTAPAVPPAPVDDAVPVDDTATAATAASAEAASAAARRIDTDPDASPAPSEDPPGVPSGATASPGSRVVASTVSALVQGARSAEVLGVHPITGHRNPRSNYRQAQLLPTIESIERDAIAFAHQAGVAPFSAEARHQFFAQLRAQMKQTQVGSAQLATLDIVAAMFDYATDDARIPEPVRPLLWRLQMPTVTLSCLDVGYLADDERSMRSLVEHVAAISVAYPEDIARDGELYRRLQTVVRAAEVVAHAFQIRSRVLSERVQIEYQRATYGMGQLLSRVSRERKELDATAGRRNRRDYRSRPSREKEAQVTQRIEQLVEERLAGRAVPDSVREFLKDVWVRHLRTAVLRDGEDSPGFKVALSVVDDLLWTIDGGGHRRSRRELADRIPGILDTLTQGIGDIGAKAEDYRPFFDEMFLIHLRRMQRRRSEKPATGRGDELPVLSDQVGAGPASLAPAAPRSDRANGAGRGADDIAPPDDGIDVLPLDPTPPARGRRAGDDGEGATKPRSRNTRSRTRVVPDAPATRPGQMPTATAPGPAADAPSAAPAEAIDDTAARDKTAASEIKLRRLIDETRLDDAPAQPERVRVTADQLARDLKPGDWLQLITSSRKTILAKVAWINERRSVVLLLQHPDRLILSRHLSALVERAARGRAYLVR